MILITGATGLLGGHTLFALLQKHQRVVALRREGSSIEGLKEIFCYYTDKPDTLLERIDWRIGDMLDAESLVRALDGITCVINCAAIVSFDPKDRSRLIANNVEGCRNLARAIMIKRSEERIENREGSSTTPSLFSILYSPVPHLIHISSTSALGDSPGNDPKFLVDEETPRDLTRRHSGYSESKYLSEKAIREEFPSPVSQLHAPVSTLSSLFSTLISPVFLNPGIILGPGQWGKGSSQLFVKAWEGLKYFPFGGTGYVDVRDVADVVVKIVEKWRCGKVESPEPSTLPPIHSSTNTQGPLNLIGQRFCLVGANLRYKEFFDKVTDEFGKPNPHIYAGKFLSGLAWRLDTLRARLTGRFPLLTRETAESAQRISFYSSEKIKRELGFSFRTIEDTVEWVCSAYRKRRETGVGSRETGDEILNPFFRMLSHRGKK